MPKPTLEAAFAAIAPQPGAMAGAILRLRGRFGEPHRAYHNEAHTLDVLSHLREWTDDPDVSLVAAALYHDAIYDPTRSDNETRSAALSAEELAQQGHPPVMIHRVTDLIEMTAHHLPSPDLTDAVLLVDADLYILGGTPEEYEAYRKAIRAEYAHVPEDAWRTGRARVLARFLERPRIFHGDWIGVSGREEQARRNLAGEIDSLMVEG
ncbi:MAG: HD domain-containing protein [Akkermansiaceae bacterium]|nr:HD domain-containing protein [Armatimonadota bacterium]